MTQAQVDSGARQQIKKIGLNQALTYETQDGNTQMITLPSSTSRVQTKDYKMEGGTIQRVFEVYSKDSRTPITQISMNGRIQDGKFIASDVNRYDYGNTGKPQEHSATSQ